MKKLALVLIAFTLIAGCGKSKPHKYGALSTSTTTNWGFTNGFNDGAMLQSAQLNTNFSTLDQKFPEVFTCGTIAANGACTNSQPAAGVPHIVTGIATLASNTSTITGLSPAFTSSSTYYCVANDITTRANPVQAVPASGSTVTFTNTTGATDNISFMCIGN